MTADEFKLKYPIYSHLEGDELWDKMTEVLLTSNEVLVADPNREIIYHEPVILDNGLYVYIENSSTTRWLNSKGEEVKLKETTIPKPYAETMESYRFDIINFNDI